MANRELLLRAKKLLFQTQTPTELYGLSHITNIYIDTPTKENTELLEIYCDMLESSLELDQEYIKQLKK